MRGDDTVWVRHNGRWWQGQYQFEDRAPSDMILHVVRVNCGGGPLSMRFFNDEIRTVEEHTKHLLAS